MAGAFATAPIGQGCGYVGDWSKEDSVTIVPHLDQFHVCLKESSKRKQIAGIFAGLKYAKLFAEMLRHDPKYYTSVCRRMMP